MNSLQQATMKNNQGACFLHSGSIVDSIACFQAALSALNVFANTDDEQLQSLVPGGLVAPTCFHPNMPFSNHSEDACYIYDRPLLITTNALRHSRQDVDTFFSTCSTFIIFNLALAYHQSGRMTGKETPLKQAESMYKLVLQSLIGSQCTSMSATLKCLTFNNLAQLHFERCDYMESYSYMESMYGVIKQTGCLHGCNVYLSAAEVEEIKLNLLHVHAPTAAHAA